MKQTTPSGMSVEKFDDGSMLETAPPSRSPTTQGVSVTLTCDDALLFGGRG